MTFLILFQFSCQDEVDYVKPIPNVPGIDIADILGEWTAKNVEFKKGEAYKDVSEQFTEFTISIYENSSSVNINGNVALFGALKWEKQGDGYFNIFTNPESRSVISIYILSTNASIMTVRIKNMTPYINKLFAEESNEGNYKINLVRQ